jgi:hypothetical protein
VEEVKRLVVGRFRADLEEPRVERGVTFPD